MFKRLICTLSLLVLLILPISAFAAGEVSFSLTDVSTEQNRLFETTLCASGEVAAFTATLTYDETAIEYRSAKAVGTDASLSVNSNESGKVKIAYLCENGATGELVKFTFKSADKSSSISLTAEQVIDTKANDLSVTSLKGAEVSVISDNKTDTKLETEAETTETAAANTSKSPAVYKELTAENGSDVNLILCVAGGVVLVLAVALLGFFLGRSSAKNNNNRKT